MRPRRYACTRCNFTTGLAGALLVLCLGGATQGLTVYLQDLGSDFVPTAGNSLGHLVGYRLSTGQAAWRHPDGQIEDLGTLGGAQSRATAISDDGTVVVGWAHNASGVQNSFRFEGTSIISLLGTSATANQAVGVDSANNVYANRQDGTPSVRRWNRVGGTTDILLIDRQATGVNGSGKIVGIESGGTIGFSYSGSATSIPPFNYLPTAGLSDSNLSAGQMTSLAAFFRLGDAMAQTIPGILALGGTSTATGVNDHDLIVGNAAATVFLYSVIDGSLTDLNSGNFDGAEVFYLLELYGMTDANIFFGKYINFLGELRYFRGSLEPDGLALAGDFDADGDVDGRDFLLWQRNPALGNLADWQGNYGLGGLLGLAATSSIVPEPSVGLQVVCALILLCVRRSK